MAESALGGLVNMEMRSRVVRADDPQRESLERDGWRVIARSWGAHLEASDVDRETLQLAVAGVANIASVRRLTEDDVDAVLALDRRTCDDYPGGIATRHRALTRERARVGDRRRGYGAIRPTGQLVAMTYVST